MGNDHHYLDDIKRQIRNSLPQYLAQHGFKTNANGSCTCFMPHRHKNNDQVPSMTIRRLQNGYRWHCFGCDEGGDTIDAANRIEGLPVSGPDFIHTILNLAGQLGIDIDTERFADAERDYRRFLAVDDICHEIEAYLLENGDPVGALTGGRFGRTCTVDYARATIGIVPMGSVDEQALIAHLERAQMDLSLLPFYVPSERRFASHLFSPESLTIAMHDNYGKSIGFSARLSTELYTRLVAEEGSKTKYKNSPLGGKHRRPLFLLDVAAKHITRLRRAVLVEGQFDAISMHVAGQHNTVATMGAAVNEDTVSALLRFGLQEIVIIFDPDRAGSIGVRKAVGLFSRENIKVWVTPVPANTDIDECIRNGNMEILAEQVDGIEYVLRGGLLYDEQDIPEQRYNKIIRFISEHVQSKAFIRTYAKIVAEISDGWFPVEISDVMDDVERQSEHNENRSADATRLWNQLKGLRDKPIVDKVTGLQEIADGYRMLMKNTTSDIIGSTWREFVALISKEKELPSVLDFGMPLFDDAFRLEGGSLALVSGWPSNGKSTILRWMMLYLLERHDDLYIYLGSTDDSVEKAHLYLASLFFRTPKDTVERYIRDGSFLSRSEFSSRASAFEDLLRRRIVVRGLRDIPSMRAVRRDVELYRNAIERSDAGATKLLVVLDAINNLDDLRIEDQRVGIENVIAMSKTMAATTGASVIDVSHLTKQNGAEGARPKASKLKGSSFLEYEAKVILLAHMEAHYHQNTPLTWADPDTPGDLSPIVELWIGKDKDRKANEVIPLKVSPLTGNIIIPDERDLRAMRDLIRGGGGAVNDGLGND